MEVTEVEILRLRKLLHPDVTAFLLRVGRDGKGREVLVSVGLGGNSVEVLGRAVKVFNDGFKKLLVKD